MDALKTIEIRGHFQLEIDLEVRLAKKGRVSLAPFANRIASWLQDRIKGSNNLQYGNSRPTV